MKKNLLIFIACVILSFGAFCDTYFMWGGDTGYENMAGNNGWYFDTFFDVQHYFFDGPIGLGLDLRVKFPIIGYRYKFENKGYYSSRYSDVYDIGGGVDFIASPTLSLRLFYHKNNGKGLRPIIKFFPVFAYSIHEDFDYISTINNDGRRSEQEKVKEPYIGGGIEICLNLTVSQYPMGGSEFFLTYNQGKLIDTKENYFSIGFGVRGFFRKSPRDERIVRQLELEEFKRLEEESDREKQKRLQEEQKRQQRENERLRAEKSVIQSGSLTEIINFAEQYGYSANIRLAIERILSGNKNATYKELGNFENPYIFEKGTVYYCSSLTVFQWISEYSFLAKVKGDIIYVETISNEIVGNTKTIYYAYLKANGVMEYNSAMSSLNIVPRFTLMLF